MVHGSLAWRSVNSLPARSDKTHPGMHPRQFGNIVSGAYTPVLAKHSKHFSLEDSLAIGVDRMQRNFGPLKQQVAAIAHVVLADRRLEDRLDGARRVCVRIYLEWLLDAHNRRNAGQYLPFPGGGIGRPRDFQSGLGKQTLTMWLLTCPGSYRKAAEL